MVLPANPPRRPPDREAILSRSQQDSTVRWRTAASRLRIALCCRPRLQIVAQRQPRARTMAMLCSARLTPRPVAAARPVALRVPIARPNAVRGLAPLKPATPARPAAQPRRLSVTAAAQPAATPAAPQGEGRAKAACRHAQSPCSFPPLVVGPSHPTFLPVSFLSLLAWTCMSRCMPSMLQASSGVPT